jgi:hypothetical protein
VLAHAAAHACGFGNAHKHLQHARHTRTGEAAPGAPHPVWRVASPSLGGFIRLLKFLCQEELTRLRVWVEPLKHADAARTTPVVSAVQGRGGVRRTMHTRVPLPRLLAVSGATRVGAAQEAKRCACACHVVPCPCSAVAGVRVCRRGVRPAVVRLVTRQQQRRTRPHRCALGARMPCAWHSRVFAALLRGRLVVPPALAPPAPPHAACLQRAWTCARSRAHRACGRTLWRWPGRSSPRWRCPCWTTSPQHQTSGPRCSGWSCGTRQTRRCARPHARQRRRRQQRKARLQRRPWCPRAWRVPPCGLQQGKGCPRCTTCAQHATPPPCLQVQLLPKAALLLATAPDSAARTTALQLLPVWAPGTGDTAGGSLPLSLLVVGGGWRCGLRAGLCAAARGHARMPAACEQRSLT